MPELEAEKRRRKLHKRRLERTMRRAMRLAGPDAVAWARTDSAAASDRGAAVQAAAPQADGAAARADTDGAAPRVGGAGAGPSTAPPSQAEPSAHGGVAAHLLRLQSAGAASEASVGASSAAGSAADAALLRQCSHQSQQSQQSQQSGEGGGAGHASPRRRLLRWGKRLKRWLLRYPAKFIFGYDPAQEGQWHPQHGYDVRRVGGQRAGRVARICLLLCTWPAHLH